MKTYRMRRNSPRVWDHATVVVTEEYLNDPIQPPAVYPLVHHYKHSDGFSWGYLGSGPSDLARCILIDHLGHPPHPAMYQDFKVEFIGSAPDDFDITSDQVEDFIVRWNAVEHAGSG